MRKIKNISTILGLLFLSSTLFTSCSLSPSTKESDKTNTQETTAKDTTSNDTTSKDTTSEDTQTTNNSQENPLNPEYTLGETFTYGDLEITVGSKVEFTTVDNEFSEEYECDVVKLPLTIKNVGEEDTTLSTFGIKVFGSQSTELESLSVYFDDAIKFGMGDLKPGASYTKAFYALYDGDGDYKMEFGAVVKVATVIFPVEIGDQSIENKKDAYGIGETFRFDFFEITAGEISFTTVDNQYSDWYNKDVIRIPLTIKNLGKEARHLNPYKCTIFSPEGVEVKTVDTYFDDSIGWDAGDIKPNASYTRAFYAKYSVNGEYSIEFENMARTITLKFQASK